MYGINSFATTLINSTSRYPNVLRPRICAYLSAKHVLVNADSTVTAADEYKNDPRNPAAKTLKPTDKRS